MAKRKPSKLSQSVAAQSEESGSDNEDFDMLDVDFEWFDPQPAYDFHGVKTLLQQLLDIDAHMFDLSALTNIILEQPLLGSTVKVDGNETDPYAFLSVVNLQQHRAKHVVSKMIHYLQAKANSTSSFTPIAELLSLPNVPSVGLILTERLINVPAEITAPMYTMLLEEIQWALEEKEPYTFSHYLILSKTYTEVTSQLDEEDRPKKKKKGGSDVPAKLYFHPEDEIFEKHSVCHGHYDYSTQHDEGHSDSKRAFQEMGIKPQGQMALIEAAKFEQAVKDVADYMKPAG